MFLARAGLERGMERLDIEEVFSDYEDERKLKLGETRRVRSMVQLQGF